MDVFQTAGEGLPGTGDPNGTTCVLAAGDAGDLAEMRDWLEHLPESAYGQVLIEVSDEGQIVPLTLPAGVAVTWLRGEAAASAARSEPRSNPRMPGEHLIVALGAWLSEWVWPESSTGREFLFWIGAEHNPGVSEYWESVERRLDLRSLTPVLR